MSKQLTLIAVVDDVLRSERRLPEEYKARPTSERDKPSLAGLYFAAYGGEIVGSPSAAEEELERTFGGEYGRLDPEASPMATHMGAPVGSVMTVTEAPWADTPHGPFIIEVMVHPGHRERGLAEHLMMTAARSLARRGKKTVALRVMSDNEKALALYKKLGFIAWDPADCRHREAQ